MRKCKLFDEMNHMLTGPEMSALIILFNWLEVLRRISA